jgi:uncharacterized protein (TIGR01777 family)
MPTVLVTGGTGMIGTALTKALVAKGYEVIILTRDKKPAAPYVQNISYAEWSVSEQKIDEAAIRSADYIVHLAGANVAEKRWTSKRKKEIIDSRVRSGQLIVDALKRIPNHVKAVISSAAIGYYGPDKEIPSLRPFIETDPPANDFLGTVVQEWEQAIQTAGKEKRLVIFRTGIVLSNEAGAYAEFKKSFRFKIATILGNGSQVMSWIHIDDLVRLYIEAIENENWKGTYNAVAPKPVSNKQMLEAIGSIHGKHLAIHIPSFALKLVLGEMSIEVLKSTTVSSQKLQQQGFKFLYPDISAAVADLEKGI